MSGFGTFFGLNVAVSGLQTAQQALSVIGNNIANASTPGYTDETANVVEATPFPPLSSDAPIVAGQVGQGSSVGSVTRNVNPFYNKMLQDNTTNFNGQDTLLNNLNQIQGIIGEPSATSIHSAIDTFFSSWQTLSQQPDSTAARSTVIQNAQDMADTMTQVQNQLVTVVNNLDTAINDPNAGEIAQVNNYAKQLNDLNSQISSLTTAGENPNQLLDQRDQILNHLAKLGNIATSTNNDGSMSVTFGNVQIVTASGAVHTTTDFTYANVSSLTSGSIWANVQGLSTAQGLIQNLGTLQGAIASNVNTLLESGYQYQNSTHGADLFAITTKNVTTGSGNNTTPVEYIQVPTTFTADQLAAAQQPNVSGDGSNALAIASLQNTSLTDTSQSTPVALGSTADDYYTSLVGSLGAQTNAVQARQQTAHSLLQQSQTLQQSVSGVNQNEELTKMVEFQNMYNAAAKIITTQDQMLQTLIQAV